MLLFAKLALTFDVDKCPQFYQHTILSYNVHALLHLVQDVEQLGSLDSYSAFPYENNISFFRKYLRKPHRSLQQLAYRLSEKEKREKIEPSIAADTIKVYRRHNEGPLPLGLSVYGFQYKKLQTRSIFINVDSLGNRCCILCDSSVCIVHNILKIDNSYNLVIKKFEIVEDFYDIGILSSSIGIFKCFAMCNNFSVISINERPKVI